MITTANINTARRLLASFNDAMQYKLAHNPTPMRDWLREAKPVAGFDPSSRPLNGVVRYSLAEQVKRYDSAAAHRATAKQPGLVPDIGGDPMPSAQADALPALPDVITVHIRPGRAEEIADATTVADYNAARSPIAITARTLAQYEAEVREKVKRHAAFVGVDDEARRMLNIAAHLHEAAQLLDPNATHDEDNG